MLVYLSAPMSGVSDLNRELFARHEKMLLSMGHEVVNPCTYEDEGWAECIARDILLLKDCDAILLISPHWRRSTGCKIEVLVAYYLNIPVYTDIRSFERHPLAT